MTSTTIRTITTHTNVRGGHTMSTTTMTRPTTAARTARMAVTFDLLEPAAPTRSLDELIERDDMLVDVWDTDETDGLTSLAILGDEAVVTITGMTLDDVTALVERRLALGWAREGAVPVGIEVTALADDYEFLPARAFAQHLREGFTSWRLIEDTLTA